MSPEPTTEVRIDRIRCSGHGICAQLLPETIRLDEWGYPIQGTGRVDARAAKRAVDFCPARALRQTSD
ncbi:MAG: ferredoxin [Actinobacteria bacterium]|nr:ferredoxin [Actinomycetota bacterium]